MRESLGLVAVSDNARVWGASGRAARLADRRAVRTRNGFSLLAMAAGVSSNGTSSIGVGVVGVAIRGDTHWASSSLAASGPPGWQVLQCTDLLL